MIKSILTMMIQHAPEDDAVNKVNSIFDFGNNMISRIGLGACIFFGMAALILMLFGKRAKEESKEKLSTIGFVMIGLAVLSGIATAVWSQLGMPT